MRRTGISAYWTAMAIVTFLGLLALVAGERSRRADAREGRTVLATLTPTPTPVVPDVEPDEDRPVPTPTPFVLPRPPAVLSIREATRSLTFDTSTNWDATDPHCKAKALALITRELDPAFAKLRPERFEATWRACPEFRRKGVRAR